MSGGHGHGHAEGEGGNKKIALLISVLALFLAFAETLGKSAQTDAISRNVEASNLWAFFQAKTIRMTSLRTAIGTADIMKTASPDLDKSEPYRKYVDDWTKTIPRWESEPETGEGRKELASRAKAAETQRDTSLARYHHYELGSAAFQIGIVLASAMLITGIAALAWLAAGLGVAGILMVLIGLFAPHSVHLV